MGLAWVILNVLGGKLVLYHATFEQRVHVCVYVCLLLARGQDNFEDALFIIHLSALISNRGKSVVKPVKVTQS